MKSFYLYCIGRFNSERIVGRGVLSGSPLSILTFRQIKAVVSEIDLDYLKRKGFDKRLKEDLRLVRENALKHHQIIVKVSRQGEVIPMQFGIIFKNKRSFWRYLSQNYVQFIELLDYFKGKSEWGVRIVVDEKKTLAVLGKNDSEILILREEIQRSSPGKRWYLEKKLNQLSRKILEEKLEKIIDQIYQKLISYAERRTFLSMSASSGRVIYSNSLLVKDKVFPRLVGFLEKGKQDWKEQGIEVVFSGPWPPYSFSQMGEEIKQNVNFQSKRKENYEKK